MPTSWQRRLALWPIRQVWRLTRGVTLGVRVVLVAADGQILLVRHGYMPGWHLPGGGVDRGETIEAACIREVREETGLRVLGQPELVGLYSNFEAFPGDHVAVFVCRQFDGGLLTTRSHEIQERSFFSPRALPAGTTAGTRRRLAEVIEGKPRQAQW